MTVPTRGEALALLLSVQPSERLLQHVTVVAEVAAFLAHRAQRAGLSVDRRLVETAALLHDIDKALPADEPLRELGHGAAGAAWLRAAGHAELSRAVAAHPVMRLDAPDAAEWVRNAPLEERIVCYADKRATQRVVSLEQRFERWRRRHAEYGERLSAALSLARSLESDLCTLLEIRAEAVERLAWVAQARARLDPPGSLVGVAASVPPSAS
jgi:putative nucleotidyltransferase with HDIG domain